MGTKGAFGFRINNEDKVTYNHFDSYPGGLGDEVVTFIKNNAISVLEAAANNIKLVEAKSTPTSEQIQRYKHYADHDVSTGSFYEWYVLLRNVQGNLQAYVDDLEYMIDKREFLKDSVFCEYAYIINLDTKKLEFYKGFNDKQLYDKGRYASIPRDEKNDYYGVMLMAEFDLLDIQKSSIDCVAEMNQILEDYYNAEEMQS